MTHEELVEALEHTAQDGMADEPILKALRSVVNLHSPEGKPDQQCRNCKRFYPCHTIQAIIKELQ